MFDAMERDGMVPWGGHQGYPPQRGPFPPSYGSEYGVSLDMHETPEGFELSADLPGMRREDISVDVDNDTRVLTVSAERKNAQGGDDNGFNSQRRIHYRERSFGKMSRSIRLPEMADVTRAGATYTDGVLTLKFPRLRPLPSGRTHIPVESGTVGGQLPIAEGPPAGNFTRDLLPSPAGSPLALPPTEGYGTLALPGGSFQG